MIRVREGGRNRRAKVPVRPPVARNSVECVVVVYVVLLLGGSTNGDHPCKLLLWFF